MKSVKLNIVIALPCEARPLIDCYQLKKIPFRHRFQCYQNLDESIHLIVSGVGKIHSAAATAYLHALTGNYDHAVYLNLGIAGGKDYSIGDMQAIHKVIDHSTAKAYYPSAFILDYERQSQLMTFDSPQTSYPDDYLVDMEGSGFFQTAIQFVDQEHVQLIKIISDNNLQSQKNINAAMVEKLIKNNINKIEVMINQLKILSEKQAAKSIKSTLNFESEFLNTWRFTQYQQHELRELLRRAQVLMPDQNLIELCRSEKTSQAVLSCLRDSLDQLDYAWS